MEWIFVVAYLFAGVLTARIEYKRSKKYVGEQAAMAVIFWPLAMASWFLKWVVTK